MNTKHQIIVREGDNFHCLTSPLSVQGRYADEVWIFGELPQNWADDLTRLLTRVDKENIHHIVNKNKPHIELCIQQANTHTK